MKTGQEETCFFGWSAVAEDFVIRSVPLCPLLLLLFIRSPPFFRLIFFSLRHVTVELQGKERMAKALPTNEPTVFLFEKDSFFHVQSNNWIIALHSYISFTMASPTRSLVTRMRSIPMEYPFAFGVVFSGFKTSFSDLMVQKVVEQREQIDWKRNAAFAAFGFIYLVCRINQTNKKRRIELFLYMACMSCYYYQILTLIFHFLTGRRPVRHLRAHLFTHLPHGQDFCGQTLATKTPRYPRHVRMCRPSLSRSVCPSSVNVLSSLLLYQRIGHATGTRYTTMSPRIPNQHEGRLARPLENLGTSHLGQFCLYAALG